MKEYGLQQTTKQPEPLFFTASKVWQRTQIQPTTEQLEDGYCFSGFSFLLTCYDKDEFIRLQAEKNDLLEAQITDTQLALCELYESMGV